MALAALIFASIFGGILFVRYRARDCQELGRISDFEPESVTEFSCVPVFVVHSGGEFVGLLGLSTHLPNEPLYWDNEERLFISRYHGEAFDVRGSVVNGPAGGPLRRCPLRETEGYLSIAVPDGTEEADIRNFCVD